jgi:sorbose reductase
MMIARGIGDSIMFRASTCTDSVYSPQDQAPYNPVKAGVLMLRNCLATELAAHGILVTSISPGYLNTILNERVGL